MTSFGLLRATIGPKKSLKYFNIVTKSPFEIWPWPTILAFSLLISRFERLVESHLYSLQSIPSQAS